MPSSTGPANGPSSTNGSPPSGPTSPPSSRTAEQQRKLQLANQARLLRDNQRLLDLTHRSERAHRDQTCRMREAQMATVIANTTADAGAAEPMGDILIDSPRTENHFHGPDAAAQAPAPAVVQPAAAAPTPPQPAASLLSRVLPWALSAGLGMGGLGALAGLLLGSRPTPPPASASAPPAPAAQPATAARPQEWEIKYKVGPTGAWQTQVVPVTPEPTP